MKSNDRQVGGTHYVAEYQHWDWVTDNNLPYLVGCASKYVTRLGKKGGDDRAKAIHYAEKCIERKVRGEATEESTKRFIKANGFTREQTQIIWAFATGLPKEALRLLKREAEGGATRGYVDQDS